MVSNIFLQEHSTGILLCLAENEPLTAKTLSENLGFSLSKVQRQLNEFLELNIIYYPYKNSSNAFLLTKKGRRLANLLKVVITTSKE
jgi:predicted transcriptional regulator